jgi:hypothetical protein
MVFFGKVLATDPVVRCRVARWFVFKAKHPNLGKFRRDLHRIENVDTSYGHLHYFTAIWNMLRPLGNVVVIWYIFPRFGKLCQEKSGKPGSLLKHS